MPAGAVEDEDEDEDSVRAGGDVPADLREVGAHRIRVRGGHGERGAGRAGGTDGSEDVGPGVAAVLRSPGPRAPARPEAGERRLLADTRLVLKPHLEGLVLRLVRQRRAYQLGCSLWNGPPLLDRIGWDADGKMERERAMTIMVLGIDLGKNSCSLAGLDENGGVVLRRRMRHPAALEPLAEFIGPLTPPSVAACRVPDEKELS